MPSNLQVLLVEDNPMVLALLRQALTPLVRTLETATDGGDALLRVLEAPPDLVITDNSLPGMEGRHLLEKLRSRPQTARLPFILMATKTDISERLKPVQDSCEDLIEKPFFVKEAVGRMKRVIDKI